MQLIQDYTSSVRGADPATLKTEQGPDFAAEEMKIVFENADNIANRSLQVPNTLLQSTGKEFSATPLKVSETLILLLTRVKDNPLVLEAVIQDLLQTKAESCESEKYRVQLLKLLKVSQEESKRQIEEMANLEKDWVMVENCGNNYDLQELTSPSTSWGNTAWNIAKTSGSAAWTVSKITGKITYRLYVESTRIGSLLLLGVMVVENPLFPILQMLVKLLIK